MADGDAPDAAPPAARPDPLWDNWEAPPRVPASPELHLDGFDGPLDLLLDLAERARIDLGRISLSALIDQFTGALARAEKHVPIKRRADWLVLATRLLVLRSRLLFASTPEAVQEAEQEAVHALARLRDLQLVRAAAAWLEARPLLGRDVFTRPRRQRDPRVASYMRLMEACLTVLQGRDGETAPAEPIYRPAIPELYRLPEAIARMRKRLAEAHGLQPFGVFLPPIRTDASIKPVIARSALASTFVAALELARTEEAMLAQDRPFDVIGIGPARGRQDRDAEPPAA